MAAQVEVQTGEAGRTGVGGRLHLSPLADSSNKGVIEGPPSTQGALIINPELNKPAPAAKPRLTPKPFAVERNTTIRPILAPKPQTKPRPEPTRPTAYSPDPPVTPKPQQPNVTATNRPVSTNPSRPAPTSFKPSSRLSTGQTTKPVAHPFKPAPPLTLKDPGKPALSKPAGGQKPESTGLFYSASLKKPPAAEWSGSTEQEEERVRTSPGTSAGGTTMTRAKSMGFLSQIGREDEEEELRQGAEGPESSVVLRAQPRGSRSRPVSAIFVPSPSQTESQSPAARWAGRRPLSADLTSKFESIGLSLHRRPVKEDSKENNTPEEAPPPLWRREREKGPEGVSAAPQGPDDKPKPASSTHGGDKKKEEGDGEKEEEKSGGSIKRRISLLLDSSSSPAGERVAAQGPEPRSPVTPIPEGEAPLGIKQRIKQLTEDTPPTQSVSVKPAVRARPLPPDLTKRFASERSTDLSSPFLNEATDRHESDIDPQRRAEDSTASLGDQEKVDENGRGPQEHVPSGGVQTVRAALFENVVERHSVLVVEEDRPRDQGSGHGVPRRSFSLKRGEVQDDFSRVTPTYREPMSPSSPQRVEHSFDTVQPVERSKAVSECLPLAQLEDKAMTLRSRRSEGSRPARAEPAEEKPAPAGELAAPPEHSPRYLRVGALPKWNAAALEAEVETEQERQRETVRKMDREERGNEREAEGRMPMDVDREKRREKGREDVAAPKRLKMLEAEEQSAKPRATYFALTGQIQEPVFHRDEGAERGDMEVPFDDYSVKSGQWGSQRKVLPLRRNASLDEAFGKGQERDEELLERNQKQERDQGGAWGRPEAMEDIESETSKQMEKQKEAERQWERSKELEKQREYEVERQKQLEKERKEREKQKELERRKELENERLRELEKQRQRELERDRQRALERQQELKKQQDVLRQKELERERRQELERERQQELERERQRERQRELVRQEERLRLLELERQTELEKERLKEFEKERLRRLEMERQKELEKERLKELEKERLKLLENERLKELEKERLRQQEIERQKEIEREKLRQSAKKLEMQREQQREQQRLDELERIKEMERKQLLEFEKQKQAERQRQQIEELEKQRLREKREREEADKMRQIAIQQEVDRQRELERERERQREVKEKEQQRELEVQRQRESERQKQEKKQQRELEVQRQMELERQKQEREKQRELEVQRQRDLERQKQLDAERQELDNQRTRQREFERERQKLEELERTNEMERRQLLEFEKQKHAERQRQQIQELEKQRLREKIERDEVYKKRQVALEQAEMERHKSSEKQRREDSSPLRPKVLDLDSVTRDDQFSKSSPHSSDPSSRWRQPSPRTEEHYRPAILDIDSFKSQAQSSPTREGFPVAAIQGSDPVCGARSRHHTPEREGSRRMVAEGTLVRPVWAPSQQELWDREQGEAPVDRPAAGPEPPKKPANKPSLEKLLLRQEERAPNPRRELNVDGPVGGSGAPTEQVWFPRGGQPQGRGAETRGPRRSQASQDLNRMRSRSVSRRSAPSDSSVESSLSRMRSRSAHRERDFQSWESQKQTGEDEEKDTDTLVHETDSQYGTWETGLRTDDSLTPATPTSESNLTPSPRKPTPPHTPGDHAPPSDLDTPDGQSPDEPEILLLPFPEASTPLLDSSALRSRAQLSKARGPRSRPSRAARQSAALVALPEGQASSAEDWRSRDSTEEKVQAKQEDSDSEEQQARVDSRSAASQPQRVPLFPGVDPSALKAQLKKRGDSDNQTDGPAPPQLSRSPKSPFLPQASRVLPPAGGKVNGEEESPQWLKELKSKKRLSQYDNDS